MFKCVRFPIQCYGDADTYPPAAPLIHELLQCVRSGLGTLASLAPTLSLSCTIGLVLPDLGILVRRRLIPCISAFLTAFILLPTSSHPSPLHYIYFFVVSPVPVPAPRPSRLRLQNDRNPASHATPSVPPGSSDVPHHAVPHSTTLYATNTPVLSPSRSSRSALTPYLSALFLDPSLPLSLPLPECPMTVNVDYVVSFEAVTLL
ncbi:hypothetical protein B0H13DRAFT_2374877 [Mycena leptocephala]|nr:hypothetical protein B0H13DRAFT_2374877 [Mycena leptocephala]